MDSTQNQTKNEKKPPFPPLAILPFRFFSWNAPRCCLTLTFQAFTHYSTHLFFKFLFDTPNEVESTFVGPWQNFLTLVTDDNWVRSFFGNALCLTT